MCGNSGANCGGDGSSIKGSDGIDYRPVSGVHVTISKG
jgi:hypothetical protein